VFEVLRFLTRKSLLGIADFAITMPLVRWSWTAHADDKFVGALVEFRPTDPESVRDMMAGRYLLASKLIDTGGVSPFGMEVDHDDWLQNLHGFSWLRHFRDVRDEGERRFARTLVLDWIGREGKFNHDTWAPALCAQRVLNWLRHYNLIIEGAGPDQTAAIGRALGSQIQSLRLRARLSAEPTDALFASIALAGAALCSGASEDDLAERVRRLEKLLSIHLDADGLYRNRSAKTQLQLLVELTTVKLGLMHANPALAQDLLPIIERMHKALDALTSGTGEPAYFNGCGQLPHDVLISVQSQTNARQRESGIFSGYGLLLAGDGTVIADGGAVPPPAYAGEAHAGALAFEFSQGRELVVGSCGPAPAELAGSRLLFRKGAAHSAPTIEDKSAARIAEKGPLAGRLLARGAPGTININVADKTLALATNGFQRRFGVILERRLTLMSEGKTLVGQDKITLANSKASPGGTCVIRFHLAPGSAIYAGQNQDIVHVRLASNKVWTFLWEGARMHEEDSVRQSAHFGFHRTRQIVLEAPVEDGHEIAWIFTLDE
jgi:uncharacterized heparinase superfamily protein